MYIYIYSIYKSASIKTPVFSPPFSSFQDLSLKLRVAKTGVPEPRAAPKRHDKRRSKDKRQRRATGERTSRNGAVPGAVAKMAGDAGDAGITLTFPIHILINIDNDLTIDNFNIYIF